ncbi:SRPBCC family protein [Flavimarina sp. Hel_I_48]|uniref:SRPBCC family protein n=1 Tax=Flavimarina sp. Hel_I_48 TaxID=1392488 RepID=UPI0004DF40F4|nr:GyrI-like domain-containing protein [Flavimarina sp. Hel_I_48]
MKIIKYLFFLLLLVFIGGALYFATKDGSFQIEKSELIEAPVPVVFKKVNDYKSWENWGPWKKEDSTMIFNYPEKTSGEGAGYSWNGKEWDGSLKTVEVIPNQSIKQTINFETAASQREADVYWRFEKNDKGTEVTWGMQGEHSLVDKAYFSIFNVDFDTDMRKMITDGLTDLRKNVEKELEVYTINVDGVTQYGGGYYMYRTTATSLDAIPQKITKLLPTVASYMEQNTITRAGSPMTIYNSYDKTGNTAIISAAMPTTTRVIVPDDSSVLCGFMPAQTVIKSTLKGNYKNLNEAIEESMTYLTKNGYERADDSNFFAIYVNDRENVPNPADWLTEIYIPIKSQEEGVETSGIEMQMQ